LSFIPFFRKKPFFSAQETQSIVDAVRTAERQTSGEVRVFVENRCRFVDPLDRAAELFFGLKMDQTVERNGVLVYIAIKDHQLAVLGDVGIHQKVGTQFWEKEVQEMISEFNRDHYADGIVKVVKDIGEALELHFPFQGTKDKNELPDDIVFGR
jgi:uncharacterized membrane protein